MTDKMKEAINLLQKEEFYLCKTNGKSVWLSYNLGSQAGILGNSITEMKAFY